MCGIRILSSDRCVSIMSSSNTSINRRAVVTEFYVDPLAVQTSLPKKLFYFDKTSSSWTASTCATSPSNKPSDSKYVLGTELKESVTIISLPSDSS